MKKLLLPITLFCLMLTNCTPFKIPLADGLSSSKELPVKGRTGILIHQKLTFGDFYTEKINRSWTEGSSYNLGPMKVLWANYSQKKQSIHFSLKDNAESKSEVFCLSKVRSEDFSIGKNENSIVNIMADILGVGGNSDNTYAVSIFINNDGIPWNMVIDNETSQRKSKQYVGYLAQNKNNYYTIHPITSLEKNGKKSMMPFGSVGFEIRNKDGKSLAAVSLMDKGAVYMGETDAKEKFLLANAIAALLLQENLG